jgi:hypothetical protein
MAAREASRLAKPAQDQYLFDLDPTRGGVASRQIAENRGILRAGEMRPVPLSEQAINRIEDKFDNADQRERAVAAARRAAESRRVAVNPLASLAGEMAGGTPSANDLYGAAMARMDVVRGRGDLPFVEDPETGMARIFDPETGFDRTSIGDQLRYNALRQVTPNLQSALERELDSSGATRQQEIADAVAGILPSDFMQRVAVERLGYDPALAAGLFSANENLAYEQMLVNERNAESMRQGYDPNANEAERVLAEYGPEGLAQYQAQQAEYALYGTPSQQLAAQKNEQDAINAQADADIIADYGFDPNNVTNVEADQIRQLMTDPQFALFLEDGRERIVTGNEDALKVAQDIAEQYREVTNQTLGAEALRQILASFDLVTFG